MAIGTQRLENFEFEQSYQLTRKQATTKRQFKALIDRNERRSFVAEIEIEDDDVITIVPCGPCSPCDHDYVPTTDDEIEAAIEADMAEIYEGYEAQAIFDQAMLDNETAWNVSTGIVYGDTLEMWDAEEWTMAGFSIVTL